jgi:NAD(P)-dependent dehydrogenase (short-subunit alcohol dehydrogenase family)
MSTPPEAVSPVPVHPGLVDSCLQALVAGMPAEVRQGSVFVPVGIESLRWAHRLGTSGECHARLRDSICNPGAPADSVAGDVLLRDDTGALTIAMEGVHLRRAARETLLQDRRDDDVFEVAWQPASAALNSARGRERGRARVCDFSSTAGTSPAEWHARAVAHCTALLDLAHSSIGGAEGRVLILTAGAQCVLPGSAGRLAVDQAAVWGMGRVLAAEFPEFDCCLLDVDPAGAPAEIAAQIEHERTSVDRESQVAYRGGVRYVARLVPHCAPHAGETPLRLRADARYLITGGTGGLGLHVARWMVTRGARHLVLAGRRGPSSSASAAIAALRSDGAVVDVVQCDVSVPGEITRALRLSEAGQPPLRGVVHAAGVLDDGLLLRQDSTRLAAVLAPKVAGGANLHAETLDQPLDFFVLFSSAASILGPEGQGTYAAGNGFLDALAYYRRAAGLPALAVSWGPWASTGMAAENGLLARGGFVARSFDPIDPGYGIELLERMIACRATHAAVLPIRWATHAEALAGGRVPELWAALVRKAQPPASPGEAREAEPTLARLLRSAAPASRPAIIAAHVQQLASRVMGLDSSSPLAPQARLFDAGMNSLMALELHRHLQFAIGPGRTLPSTIVFDYPTIAGLATRLRMILDGADAVPTTKEPAIDDIPEMDIDQLSQAQVESILDERLAALEALEQHT